MIGPPCHPNVTQEEDPLAPVTHHDLLHKTYRTPCFSQVQDTAFGVPQACADSAYVCIAATQPRVSARQLVLVKAMR